MERKIIGQFKRNENETIIVSIGSYRDKEYVDIRAFFQPEGKDELVPTKKGLTLAINLVPNLIECLTLAKK